MKNTHNKFLVLAGCCSFSIAILHCAIVIGGGDWYRFFGAGAELAAMAENGSFYPLVITTAIILTFSIFGLYAFSGAGLICRLPFTKAVLIMITCVYLTRGIGSIPIILFVEHPYLKDINTRIVFIFVSSILSLIIGVFYGIGTLTYRSGNANNRGT